MAAGAGSKEDFVKVASIENAKSSTELEVPVNFIITFYHESVRPLFFFVLFFLDFF